DQALDVLHDMDGRLALIEESLKHRAQPAPGGAARPAPSKEEIKRLLPSDSTDGGERPTEPSDSSERPHRAKGKDQERPKRGEDEAATEPQTERRGSGVLAPQIGGCGPVVQALVWGLLLVLGGAVIIATVVFLVRWWLADRAPVLAAVGRSDPSLES